MRTAMDCARFDRRLDALLDGTCSAGEWREAEAHADECARCRSLIQAMAGAGGRQDEAEAEATMAAVLARTSGGACSAARDHLCDLLDETISPLDRELVEGHLARCHGCSALLAALARATAVLPSFASVEPRASLVPSVLAATSRRPPQPGLADRVAEWLGRLAARPRIGFEAAYVFTLLIALLVGDPVAAFRETSSRGLEYAQPRVEQVLDRVAGGPLGGARALVAELKGRADSLPAAGEQGLLESIWSRLSEGWGWLRSHLFESLRVTADRIVTAVKELVAANPDGEPRVIKTTE